MTDPRRAQALAWYRAGQTTYEIAIGLGVHNRTVAGWIGSDLRRTGPRGRTDVPDELIVRLRDGDRLSFGEVAEAVGMSKTGVIKRYRVATEGHQRDRERET
ncbi:MAG: helix-turn-helix domain-containing protein [Gammaproteobacteria bacterium]